MTEDEFVEYIFSSLRAKGIEPLSWYDETLRMIWRGYDVHFTGRRNGKTVLLRELHAARDLIIKHRTEYFSKKKKKD